MEKTFNFKKLFVKYLKFFEGRLLIFFELHFDDLGLETVRAQLQEVSSFQKQGTP